MFPNCSSLINLPDISKWNTTKAKGISRMFADANHNFIFLIFYEKLRILLIYVECFMIAYHYYLPSIFENGTNLMLKI